MVACLGRHFRLVGDPQAWRTARDHQPPDARRRGRIGRLERSVGTAVVGAAAAGGGLPARADPPAAGRPLRACIGGRFSHRSDGRLRCRLSVREHRRDIRPLPRQHDEDGDWPLLPVPTAAPTASSAGVSARDSDDVRGPFSLNPQLIPARRLFMDRTQLGRECRGRHRRPRRCATLDRRAHRPPGRRYLSGSGAMTWMASAEGGDAGWLCRHLPEWAGFTAIPAVSSAV